MVEQQMQRLRNYFKVDAFGNKNAKTLDQILNYMGMTDKRALRDMIHFLRTVEKMPITACATEGIGYFLPDQKDPKDCRYVEIFVSENMNRLNNIQSIINVGDEFLRKVDRSLPMRSA